MSTLVGLVCEPLCLLIDCPLIIDETLKQIRRFFKLCVICGAGYAIKILDSVYDFLSENGYIFWSRNAETDLVVRNLQNLNRNSVANDNVLA